jgi:hypothetical protein
MSVQKRSVALKAQQQQQNSGTSVAQLTDSITDVLEYAA